MCECVFIVLGAYDIQQEEKIQAESSHSQVQMLITDKGVMEILLIDHYLNLCNDTTPQKGVIKSN